MPSIAFESDPTGANIEITSIDDGVSDLEAFRAECMSGGEVVCAWATLEGLLSNHTVSMLWWELTENERRSIVEKAVKNTLFFNIRHRRMGMTNCGGGTGDWTSAICTDNALIRYFKFISSSLDNIDEFYWNHPSTSIEFCYVADNCFGLPGHTIQVAHFEDGFFHTMCGIHVKLGIDDLNNWIIFQYSDFDITPGHWQMPSGSTVRVYTPIDVGWIFYSGDLISAFYDV